MFPEPDQTTEGLVYWSSSAGRFYQQGRSGALSNAEGIQYLTLRQVGDSLRYVDQLGHFAPDPANLNYPGQTNTFVNIQRTLTPVGASAYEQRAPTDSYYVTSAIYTADDGTVRMTTIYSAGGRPINFEDEQRRLAAAIANDLNIPMGAEGSSQVLQRATTLLHYTAA
jgi:hypothetical protein